MEITNRECEQNLEHLHEKLKKYSSSDYYPYHMPGHKRRLAGDLPEQIIDIDITEIEGFDNLHQSQEILLKLQEKAAALYGAEESFYLVNGSTCGILAAISAAVPKGGHILMARNCHKSAYHAIYLRNLTVSYLYPSIMEEYDINDAITPKQVKEALEKEPDIQAVLLVSPTYEGRIAEVEQIAEIVHKKGIPLIIDEAHGAHLGWVKELGTNSCQADADLVIHSVHKTLPAMTQTALLHVNGDRVDRNQLRRFLHIYQSSSPSYVLMASIDNALHLMEKKGHRLLEDFANKYDRMLRRLKDCNCLEFLDFISGKQDIGKLVISAKKFGLSGQRLYDILLREYHLQTEMAAGSYCLAMFTVGDGDEAYQRMTEALLDVDKKMVAGHIKPDRIKLDGTEPDGIKLDRKEPDGTELDTTMSVKIRTTQETVNASIPLGLAWDMEWELVTMEEAINKHVGEFINLYPPGIPLLVPGEVLTKKLFCQITSYLEQNLNVQGVEKNKDTIKIKVLRE